MIRNFHDAAPKVANAAGGNGYSLAAAGTIIGSTNPYVYPDNLPRVNARGGPGRTARVLAADHPGVVAGAVSGDGHRRQPRAIQPPRARPADVHRIRLGTPIRGEHDQPMKTTGTAVKLGILWLVLSVFTVTIIVVFGQMRFDRTTGYSAVFTNVSGLRGRAVRPRCGGGGRQGLQGDADRRGQAGVGRLHRRELAVAGSGDDCIDSLPEPDRRPLPGAASAAIAVELLAPGATIPLEHTHPALDLDALIGGFRPLFKALDPDKVNRIAESIITVFQGQGATISDILDQTASLTATLADRDRAIGEIINNLNTVLATTVKHEKEFDGTVDKFEVLITGLKNRADPLAAAVAHIGNAAGTLADLLGEDRPLLHSTVGYLEGIQQPLINELPTLDDVLRKLPDAYRIIGRAGGTYGDFFNFYLCDLSLKVNGLQPGGPVRTVKLFGQPTGRCMPQ